MRLVLVSQEYPPDTAHGGIATQTRAKAHGLAALGHDVLVVTRSTFRQRFERIDEGVRVIGLTTPYDNAVATDAGQWLVWSAAVAAELAAEHIRHPIDVVDVPDYGGEGYVHLLDQEAWSRVPTVLHLHGPVAMLTATLGWPTAGSPLHRVATHMERTCLELADAVMSSSRCSIAWCERAYQLDLTDVQVVHTGVETELFRPRSRQPERPPTVVFAGRLTQTKGVDVLVEAACSVAQQQPDLRLVLIGRGDEAAVARLKSAAAQAGHPDLLDVRGPLPRHELAVQLPEADVFAAPSEYEGGPGLVYLEAMSCGLPVIACSGSGAAEVIDDGETGRLVPPRDPTALAAALEELLGPAGPVMGRRGREVAVSRHETQQQINRLEAIYSAVAAGSRAT